MRNCAKCGRQLLSQASAKCSWCGALVEDAAFQAQANVERAAFFAHAAAHDAASLAAMESIGFPVTIDPLSLSPAASTMRRARATAARQAQDVAAAEQAREQQRQAEASAARDETEQAEERFRHLEI